jgi:hypothetical protein
MSRDIYEKLVTVVGGVIRNWDPYGLLAGGAPSNEFDQEIALVAARVKQIKTETDCVPPVSLHELLGVSW